jgi:integrase
LTALIRRAVAAADLPDRCRAHGLRKAGLRRLAEHGASTKELQSMSGHRTLAEVERYTARADRAKLSASAVAKLGDETENKSG